MGTKMSKIETIRGIIKNTNGLFFCIRFIKSNGELRELNGRTGVTAYLKEDPRICKNGTSNTVGHIPKYIKAYDLVNGGYRNINMETVTYFKCGEVELDFLK